MDVVHAEVLKDPAALFDIESDWRRLWQAQARREVFTSYEWMLAAWECFGHGQGLHLVVVRRAGAVVGLLALLAQDRTLRFLSGAHADYNDMLVCDPQPTQVVEAALGAVLKAAGALRVSLVQIPEWSTLGQVCESLSPALRQRIVVQPGQPCPALRLTPDKSAVLASMLSKQSLKRHEKKLAKYGTVRLRHVTDRDEIRALLPDFYAQHVARRAMAGGRSHFLQAPSRQFFETLVSRFDPADTLRFAVLEVGDRAAAYHLGFEVAGRFTWYKPTFDIDDWDCGPGEVLIKKLLEYLKDRPVDEFDFTRGGESFKDRFSNHQGRNADWSLHGSAFGARIERLRLDAVAALKARPSVHSTRSRLAAWRGHAKLLGQRAWGHEERLVLETSTAALRNRLEQSVADTSVTVTEATLRTLAQHSVLPAPWVDIAGLQVARERLATGERAYLCERNGVPACMAWQRSGNVVSPWGSNTASPVEAAAAVCVVEVNVGNAGGLDAAAVDTLLLRALQGVVLETVWLVVDVRSAQAASLQSRLGFTLRSKLRNARFFAGRRVQGNAAPT